MNAELIDSRRSAAESRVLGMNAEVSTCRRADVSTWNAGVRMCGGVDVCVAVDC